MEELDSLRSILNLTAGEKAVPKPLTLLISDEDTGRRPVSG